MFPSMPQITPSRATAATPFRGNAMPRISLAALLTLSFTLCITGCGAADSTAAAKPVPAPASAAATMSAGNDNLRITNDVRVYQAVKDAVVNITSSHTITGRISTGNPVFDTIPLDVFTPEERQKLIGTAQLQSLGSGFVIHPSGYIITNEHVVEAGTDIQCVFSNGDKLAAQVIATDNEHDLAVLKVTPPPGKTLTAVALGASEDLMVGEPVYAIGNPFGYAGTMTRGIVSAVDRTLDVSPQKSYKGLIQTDASINPGNSGGPLLNAYGQVIGINTAIRANAQGIGFAISVSNMRDLLPAFLNPEVLSRAQVGFTLEEKRTSKPPATTTAAILVKQVTSGSTADKAGLKAGDQVDFLSGTKAVNIVDALVALSSAKTGDNLAMEITRGTGSAAKEVNIILTVDKAPPPPESEVVLTSKMGITGETVTPAVAAKNHLVVAEGVLVNTVTADSPAGKCGLQPGDVIVQLDIFYIRSVDDIATVLKMVKNPVSVQFGIIRGNAHGRGTISLK